MYKKQSDTLFFTLQRETYQAKDTCETGKKEKKKYINGLLFTHLPKTSTTKTKAQLFPHDKGCIDSAPKNKLLCS